MTAADPIPAIREEDATGETAAVFADLRTTLAVPFVNLIWRHLATIPAGLKPTWDTLKPLYAGGELSQRLPELREQVTLPDILAIPAHVWDCAGLGRDERDRIKRLIEEYNHANGVNFLGLLVGVSLIRGEAAGGDAPPPAALASKPLVRPPDAPRLLGLSELSPAQLQTVRDLDAYGRLGENAAIASLYRHLAHWPTYLALAHTALGPHHRSGALRSAQERVLATGRTQAAELAAMLPPSVRLPTGEARHRVLAALDEFTRLMIGRMIVMGHVMGTLLPTGQEAISS